LQIVFAEHAWEDYLYWRRTDQTLLKRIHRLLQDIQRSPFDGIGKPEPLRHGLYGFWSRRINDEHRMVYKVEGDSLYLAQLRYHY